MYKFPPHLTPRQWLSKHPLFTTSFSVLAVNKLDNSPNQQDSNMDPTTQFRQREWTKESYLVSTDPSKIPVKELMEAFASETFYWATPVPEHAMRTLIDNSLCFGLYQPQDDKSQKFIGFARGVTDFVTFLYLTDVWVDSAYQGAGLGRFMVNCIQEIIEDMPYLRRSMLFTGDWERSVPFYEKLMGMKVIEFEKGKGLAVMEFRGAGNPWRTT